MKKQHHWLSLDNEENIILTISCSGSTGIKSEILGRMNHYPTSIGGPVHLTSENMTNTLSDFTSRTLPEHSKLHVILRHPRRRFSTAIKMWKKFMKVEDKPNIVDRMLDYAEAGCDESHLSPVSEHLIHVYAPYKDRMTFYRIEEAEKWQDSLGFVVPRVSHAKNPTNELTNEQWDRFDRIFAKDLELYKTLEFPVV